MELLWTGRERVGYNFCSSIYNWNSCLLAYVFYLYCEIVALVTFLVSILLLLLLLLLLPAVKGLFSPGFLLNLSNIFLACLPNFSLHLLLQFQWLQLLLVQSYISGSTFAVSLCINSCILASFPLPFAQHFCLRVLPHLSVCMFSLFCF